MKALKVAAIVYDTEMQEFHVCRLDDYEELKLLFSKITPDNTKFYPGDQAFEFLDYLIKRR